MSVSTAIAGRARFSINLRYAADQRSDPQALRRILVPVQATGSVADLGGANAGAGARRKPAAWSLECSRHGRWHGIHGRRRRTGRHAVWQRTNGPRVAADGRSVRVARLDGAMASAGAAVPLGELADVRVTTGPPMIKDENGVLVGYVFADIDQTQRDLGGWVDDAKTIVASQLALPAGAPAAVDGAV